MLSAREQNFFEFFLSEIEKVNKWYFEQASLFRTKLNSMERQVLFLYSIFIHQVTKFKENTTMTYFERSSAKKQIQAGIQVF